LFRNARSNFKRPEDPLQESIMTPTLAFASPASQFNREPETKSAPKPELTSSYSLIVVMVVYVLFGAAGFFAAAQML
jgi:hypothetical protein